MRISRPRALRALAFGAAFVALWVLLAEATLASLLIGLPCVVLGRGGVPPRAGAALALAPRFLLDSFRGALGVAVRALGLKALPTGRCVRLPVEVPYGRGRLLLMNMVSLVPGTLTVCDDGRCLTVHVLDGDEAAETELAVLAERVSRACRPSAESASGG